MKRIFVFAILTFAFGIAQAQEAGGSPASGGVTAASLIGRYNGSAERGQAFSLIISSANGNEVQGSFGNNNNVRNRACPNLAATGRLEGNVLAIETEPPTKEGCPAHKIRFVVSADGRQLDGEMGRDRQKLVLTK